ncbi:intraflagellar transport protein 88 homolog isoform X1 [Hippoglossus stenolepis]|uniref:intraflagellar transport protein 88 homolog isoform X1 n=1 Tax=Hippoglossus stenolepis TaxID=195615 RepID=UPI001FAFBD44|nr:intraflagellar transport protein 88 homolog isoform X1 [Hippoglossus stenolepis]XP_047198593.1 intraflagellar transport protein 88 homolog isoform X1 [Hippoglossus stenolepis]
MENVHLALEEEDLYSGYNDYNPTFDSEELENDAGFQQAVRTSHGRRPPMTAKFPGTAIGARPLGTSFGSRIPMTSSMGRPVTGAVQDGAARPMTAVRAAGYTSSLTRGSTFDPLGQSRGPAPSLEAKNEDTPEEKIKILEKKVNDLIEESCMAQSIGALQLSLEKAKEAGRKERALVRQREQTGNADHINLDLTYSVLLNLANQYENNEMYPEALNSYQVIVKNKMFNNAGRLKVNMANIYFKQKNYPKAIKFYRMALDQISNAHKEMRIKIMQNIGVVFVRMGQYSDAITSFEHIMSESPNIKTGFNLILCYYAIGDRERMKKAFQKLISVPLGIDDDDKYIPSNDDTSSNMVIEAIKNDKLHQMERDLKVLAEKYIMTAAKLIAPTIETSFATGFDWCVDMVKSSQYVELANDLEINKAITYLRQKDFNQVEAVETLKTFEKKDSRVKSAAATNLSFLHFLEKEYEQAERYADLAMTADRYNPAALINKGNTLFVKQDYEKAAEFYKEALRNDSSCTEALYNLGLSYKKLNRLEEALDCFLKLHAILRNSAQVMYQLAHLYELLEDSQQAIEWLMQVISVTPTDPQALAKLGELHDGEGDKSQAFQYYYDSFRYFPSNIDVIEWLGAYYIETQFCEKAIQYFERATLIQPTQVKWQLMVASCYRRSGNYQKALETYKDIHHKFPENVECLRFLVRLCTDMGLNEVQEYATKLKKVEKMKEMREQRVKSGREGSARGRREGREGSGGSAGPSTSVLTSPKKARVMEDVKAVAQSESKQLSPLLDSGKDSSHSSNSTKGERLSARMRSLPASNEPYEANSPKELDASYVDPLGPQMERPKTGAKKRVEDDDFADEELGDDLLPE